MKSEKKSNFASFLFGLLIAYRGVGIAWHIFYLCSIAIIVFLQTRGGG